IRAEIHKSLEGNDSNWATNIRTMLNTEYINQRSRNTLISAMAAVHKARRDKERREKWKPGFIGKKGEKVENVKATVEKVQYETRHYGYRETTVTKMTLQTEDGHKVYWETGSDNVPDEEGTEITFNAKVKDTST